MIFVLVTEKILFK